MSSPSFSVSEVNWETHIGQLRQLRDTVFVEEQGVPRELEWDDQDEQAWHVMASSPQGETVGTGRLTRQGQIGRMAVLPTWRNGGVGSALLQELLAVAARNHLPALFLNAQIDAIPLYKRAGFQPIGDCFTEAGILHQRMERKTDYADR